jgi:hypothetical protein
MDRKVDSHKSSKSLRNHLLALLEWTKREKKMQLARLQRIIIHQVLSALMQSFKIKARIYCNFSKCSRLLKQPPFLLVSFKPQNTKPPYTRTSKLTKMCSLVLGKLVCSLALRKPVCSPIRERASDCKEKA